MWFYDNVTREEFEKKMKLIFTQIMAECAKVFEQLPIEIEIPMGKCHGDLTFSNILFNGNNYYLIDFLDSFIESPLLDLVKIEYHISEDRP